MKSIDELWTAWYQFIQNDALATGLMPFIIHQFHFFLSCIFWLIVERIAFFDRWKLQPSAKSYTFREAYDAVLQILYTHFVIEVPFTAILHPLITYFDIPYTAPLPSIPILFLQVLVIMVIDDTYQYFLHRTLHHPILYPYIHKRHHTYKTPFALASEYATVIETSLYGFSAFCIPITLHHFFSTHTGILGAIGKMHLASIICYLVARMFHTFDSHCGYDFPWGLRRLTGGAWAGGKHHDKHHEMTIGNYGGVFGWWDVIMGTETERMVEERRRNGARGRKGKW